MRLGVPLMAALVLVFCGCGSAKRAGQTTKVIIEPTLVGININCPEGHAPCTSVSKEAHEHLKEEVKPLEHNCPKGYDLLVRMPSYSKCVKEGSAGASLELQTGLPGFGVGRVVAAQSGCLACHKIGSFGNSGPGPALTDIGSERSEARIEHALVAPQPSMPSFKSLPPQKLKALVVYLSQLGRHSTNYARPPQPRIVPTEEPESKGTGVPTPTPAQYHSALRTLAKDHAVVVGLFHGVKYRVAHKGPWTTGGTPNRLIGAIFGLSFAHPVNIVGHGPLAITEGRKPPWYAQRSQTFNTRHVQCITVEVDLTRGIVAGLQSAGALDANPCT